MQWMARLVYAHITNQVTHLGPRYTQEADGHKHACDRHLVVSKLDTIKILYAQTVCRDETVECEDLVHLDRSYKGAATLSDNMGD